MQVYDNWNEKCSISVGEGFTRYYFKPSVKLNHVHRVSDWWLKVEHDQIQKGLAHSHSAFSNVRHAFSLNWSIFKLLIQSKLIDLMEALYLSNNEHNSNIWEECTLADMAWEMYGAFIFFVQYVCKSFISFIITNEMIF